MPYSEAIKACQERTVPFSLDRSVVILNLRGNCEVVINSHAYTLTNNTLCILPPGTVIFGRPESFDLDGVVLVFNVPFFFSDSNVSAAMLGIKFYDCPCVSLTASQAIRLKNIIDVAAIYWLRQDYPYAKQSICCILELAYYEVREIYKLQEVVPKAATSHCRAVTQQFLADVSANYRTSREVNFYAARLGITPKYLSMLVKEATGRNANDWIVDTVMTNAKMALHTKDAPVQDISAELGFPNVSFFVQYFKRYNGETPSKFRKKGKA